MKKTIRILVLSVMAVTGAAVNLYSHCDTMDGPTVKDAQTALKTQNVNIILKWIPADAEAEVTRVFNQVLKVRNLNKDAKELSDAYLFDTVVRIHRNSENAPFTGVKPHGTFIDKKVLAADKAIETGNLKPLEKLLPAAKTAELKERFEKAMALKNFNVNDVREGREYIEAYVMFFKYAEGEEDGHHSGENHGEVEKAHKK